MTKPNTNNWEKELHIAMEEVRPADWYYNFIRQLLQKAKEEVLKEVENNEKMERLSCPFCNPHINFAASPDFFNQWKIKHDYHKK